MRKVQIAYLQSICRLGWPLVGVVPTRILTLFIAGRHRASVHEGVFVQKRALSRTQRFLYALEHTAVARAIHDGRSITISRVDARRRHHFAKGLVGARGNSRAQCH